MTTGGLALLGLAGLCAIANWVARARNDRRLEYLTKPAVPLLLLAAVVTVDARHPPQQAWFAVALALSLAGDVFLLLPAERFVAGLAAFLLAHVAFFTGFLAAGVAAVAFLAGLAAVGAVTLPAGVRIVGALRAARPELVGPVVAYMAVIALMVAGAVGVGSPLAVAGAVTFLASDTLLAWNRFVHPVRWAPAGVMVTYHLGLAGLVLSLAR